MSLSLLTLFDGPPSSLPLCVALTGAGGKTTLLQTLAEALTGAGRGVISTTTTQILPPNHAEGPLASPLRSAGLLLTERRSLPDVAGELTDFFQAGPAQHITVGHREVCASSTNRTKVRGLPPDDVCRLRDLLGSSPVGSRIVLLIEADGAARLPLKAHAAHEPNIPGCADMVIAVAGLDALGQPVNKTVHRSALAAEQLGVKEHVPVTPGLMAALLLRPDGPFRHCAERRAVLLNKADIPGGSQAALAVSLALHELDPTLPCHAGSLAQGRTRLMG